MSTAAQGSAPEIRRLALLVQRNESDLANENFLEGHPCSTDVFGDGVLLIFEGSVALATFERSRCKMTCGMADLKVVPSIRDTLLLQLPHPVQALRVDGLVRADEIGRLLVFMRARSRNQLDVRLAKVYDRLPAGSFYARALARYPQHHHDLWSLFQLHTVLHPPPGRTGPDQATPSDAMIEYDTDLDAVIGFHTCGAVLVKDVRPSDGDVYGETVLAQIEEELSIYVTANHLCVSGPEDEPLPVALNYRGVLAVNDWTVVDDSGQAPAMRVTYVTESAGLICYIFAGWESPETVHSAVQEISLAWAQCINRNYNSGDVFPVLDDADLLNLVYHFRELDAPGYGLVPKDVFTEELVKLEPDTYWIDLIFDMFDLTPDNRVQFTEYLIVMRTMLAGAVEDKADLCFRLYDYQKQGWFDHKEFSWTVAVVERPFTPVIRDGYTLGDFSRWLFEVLDRDKDGYITRDEFAWGTSNSEEVRNAFTALGLAPCRRLETLHPRRRGDRFVAWGHPHWSLCCALMRSIETCVLAATTLEQLSPEDSEYTECISYDTSTGEVYEDPSETGNHWEDPPHWALDFKPGYRVETQGLKKRPEFNGVRGTVKGIDLQRGALTIDLDDQEESSVLRSQNLRVVSTTARQAYWLAMGDREDIGIRPRKLRGGIPYVADVLDDSPAEEAGVPYGAIIERVEGQLVSNMQELTEAVELWRGSGKSDLVLVCIVHVDEDEEAEIAPGTRVEVSGLIANPEFNGRQGEVVDEEDDDGAVNVLLDGEDRPSRILMENLLPLVDGVFKTVRLTIPPGPDAELGINFERREDGPIIATAIHVDGPAAKAGVPLDAAIRTVDGVHVTTGEELTEAFRNWQSKGLPTIEIGILCMGPRHGGVVDVDLEEEEALERRGAFGTRIVVSEYAPRVFAELRARAGLADDDLLQAVGLTQLKAGIVTGSLRCLLEMQPGKLWYSAHNHTIVIKGLTGPEAERLLELLPSYVTHLLAYPDSLLTRYYGLYSMQWEGEEVAFAVMANAFAVPHKELLGVWDLHPGKRPRESKGGWGERRITLPRPARARVAKQLGVDGAFLADLGASRYSFLVGVHSAEADAETGPLEGGERTLWKAGALYLGSRCWSRERVLHKARQLHGSDRVRPLPPALPRKHFTHTPAALQRIQMMQMIQQNRRKSSGTATQAVSAAEAAPVQNPRPWRENYVPPTWANSPGGWLCYICGTRNSWQRTEQRQRPWWQPACAGCYAEWDVATNRRVPEEGPGHRLSDDEGRGALDDSAVDSESVTPTQQSEHTSSEAAGLEAMEDPFGGPYTNPISPALAAGQPGVPFDPSEERGQLRTIFQRFYGGTPGLLHQDASTASAGPEMLELTEIFYFSLIDILGIDDDDLTAEEYFNDFMDYVEHVLL